MEKDMDSQDVLAIRGEMDRKFAEVDQRFNELRGEMREGFARMEVQFNEARRSMTAWVVATVISCVTVTSLIAFSLISLAVHFK